MPVSLASLRKDQYPRLDKDGHVYLDHASSTLYPISLLDVHVQHLKTHYLSSPAPPSLPLASPASTSPSTPFSAHAHSAVELTRLRLLQFLNADPSKYAVIFTANASAANRLVGATFPFSKTSTFLHTADNHQSVLSIRDHASLHNAASISIPLSHDMRCPSAAAFLSDPKHPTSTATSTATSAKKNKKPPTHNLFAFPAQSNFSGVRHPLHLVRDARQLGWAVLLDATSYVMHTTLDLTVIEPDFVTLSFYKLFGFPTGVGALIVRRHFLLQHMRPPSGACGSDHGSGGLFLSVACPSVRLHSADGSAYEDGTIDYINIPSILLGLDFLTKVSMHSIRHHITTLTRKLLASLTALHWPDGSRAVRLYGPEHIGMRGGIVAFDVVHHGIRFDARRVTDAAAMERIALGVGAFQNPGALEHALGLNRRCVADAVEGMRRQGVPYSAQAVSKGLGRGFFGCVRVSVGVCSNERDVDRFVSFLRAFCRRWEKQREGLGLMNMGRDADGVGGGREAAVGVGVGREEVVGEGGGGGGGGGGGSFNGERWREGDRSRSRDMSGLLFSSMRSGFSLDADGAAQQSGMEDDVLSVDGGGRKRADRERERGRDWRRVRLSTSLRKKLGGGGRGGGDADEGGQQGQGQPQLLRSGTAGAGDSGSRLARSSGRLAMAARRWRVSRDRCVDGGSVS